MQWCKKFLSLSRAKQITFSVVSIHFLILFSLLINHWITLKPKPLRPIAVRNVVLSQEVVQEPKKTPPKPLPLAQPKPSTTAKPKIPPPNKKQAPQAPTQVKSSTIKPLPKFDDAPQKTELALPSIVSIKPRAQLTAEIEDPTLKERIVAQLQEELNLPEYGEVKVKLEIDIFGRLIDCEIIDAKSKKNAEFLKNRLPELSFPCLNESQSFTIVFKNVETR